MERGTSLSSAGLESESDQKESEDGRQNQAMGISPAVQTCPSQSPRLLLEVKRLSGVALQGVSTAPAPGRGRAKKLFDMQCNADNFFVCFLARALFQAPRAVLKLTLSLNASRSQLQPGQQMTHRQRHSPMMLHQATPRPRPGRPG